MVYTNITKGATFKLLCSPSATATDFAPSSQAHLTAATYKISHDCNSFVATTNKGVYYARAVFTLLLTATEMDADRIDIYISWNASGSSFAETVTIFTGSSSGSSLTAQDVWEYSTRTLSQGVDLSSTAISNIWTATTRSLSEAVDLSSGAISAIWTATTRTLSEGVILTNEVISTLITKIKSLFLIFNK